MRPFPFHSAARAACVLVALGASPALAQTSAPSPAQGTREEARQESRDGRYAMTPAGDGFVRLDTRTGALSHCRFAEGALQCRAGADERAALQAEIDRLAGENADLRAKLAAAGAASPGARLREALPSQEEMDRAMGWMESFMRRMMRLMREEPPPGERL
jgi:hypothetical protein